MNGFFMDESGNNGFDPAQPVLIYGGVLVSEKSYKILNDGFQSISDDILRKIKSEIKGIPTKEIENIPFIKEFEIHSKEFIDGDNMYSQVNFETRYDALKKILTILQEEKIFFYCSVVNKELFKTNNNNPKKHFQMHEMAYRELIKLLNTSLEEDSEKGFLISDNGRKDELELFSKVLKQQSPNGRIYPDLQVKDSHDSNFIQLADIAVFIITIFYRNHYQFPERKRYNTEIIALYEGFIHSNLKVWEYK